MKHWLASIQAVLLCSGCVQAQPTFMKYFSGGLGTSQFSLNELSSGNFHVGLARSSGTSVLNPLGDVLHTQCYAIDTFLFLVAVKKYADNQSAFVGIYRKDTCATSPYGLMFHPVVGRMDSLGYIASVNYYVFNSADCFNDVASLEVTSANDVITWGNMGHFFALRVSSTGAVQWARRFSSSSSNSFSFIKELPGGDLLAGINMETAGAVVARLDAGGNFIWCKSYLRPRGMVASCLIESDDSFVITGYTDSTASTDPFTPLPEEYHPKLFMLKLNGGGEVQWCKGYDSDPYLWYSRKGTRTVQALDGSYVVLANLGVVNYNIGFRPFLVKTDQNGDTLWTRASGQLNHALDIDELLACSDGGYLYGGLDYSEGRFLFKTDALGLLPCYNRRHPVVITDLFPTDSSFTLTSVDGATAYPAFVTDSVFEAMVVEDPCATTVGKPPKQGGGFRVYPNPNAGRFTVEFRVPLMADSYYSVYDAMGKLLYQRPLPTGATLQEVDLTRYGKGAYVIKLTDKGGACYERVMLE